MTDCIQERPLLPPPADSAVALDCEAWRAVRRKARRLAARVPFCRSEQEDVEQELAICLWRALSSYDPTVGPWRAFVATVLHRAAATLSRARRSRRRGQRMARWSLDLLCGGGGGELLGADAAGEMSLASAVSQEDQLELSHDVAAVVEALPYRLKLIAEQLKHFSASEVSRREGIARSTVYVRIQELRACFAKAGYSKFFGNRSDTLGADCEESI